jgi:hypothetical protein
MSHHDHPSDRAAAYRGLILGAIVLGVLLYTMVRLTNARYSSVEGGKAAATAQAGSTVALDA